MARRVPRLSEHYETTAYYFWTLGNEHSVWFYLMAAWFYEDEDEKEYGASTAPQMELTLDPW
jgi:hypothetical protein